MDKLEFNNLELQEQVQYINDQLSSTGLSVTKICEAVGIDRSTVRKRFTKEGYIFNKDLNVYEGSILNTEDAINGSNGVAPSKKVPTSNKKPPKDKANTGSTNTLEDRVRTLESQMSVLIDRVSTLSSNALEKETNAINTVNADNTGIDVTIFEGDTVTRAYRLDAQVQKEFKIFCKKNSEYKVQDLISSALQKFMDENK